MVPTAGYTGRETKLTCPSPTTTTGARGPRSRNGDEGVPRRRRETLRSFVHSPNPNQPEKKHNLCLSISYNYTVATGRNDDTKPTVYYYKRQQWKPLPHGLWSCSSKPLTGRTGLQTEGRFSLLEPQHWRHHYSLVYRNTPPDKDSSHRQHAL